jgi:prepilin-type N-terminal cleavage/methylation domain-containing protein
LKSVDNRGFTLIELLMVIIVLGILSQIALLFTLDLRTRSYDVMALADGRNLITVVRDNFIDLEEVDYEHAPSDGSAIGTEDPAGNARDPVFTLSPGVRARIEVGSESTGVPGTSYFEAWLYHENGTDDPVPPSGKREFWFIADETTDHYQLATL